MKQYPGYTLVKHEDCPEQHGTLTVLTHDVSGAAVLLVENDDDNKAFGIGFGTFPSDDTGVFHILEHSVLAGSEKYPVKSPFLQLLKSSMASFLNAMTFPDKTVYPFATPNETDFKNLMDVYLNAVFCPLAMVDKGVFEQEGWHRDEDGTVSGVVYNEMQGALATPDAQLQNALSRAMFPDTAYGFVSGGDPASIPALTYEKYVRVYRRHYSADNCCITLYGKMDMAEKLAFLDEQYLSRMPKSASRPRLTVQDEQVGAKRNIPYYTENEKITKEIPSDVVMELAHQKAENVYGKITDLNDYTVIGSDTIVVYRDEILGKPVDKQEAYDMLSMLADRTHQVYTGVSLIQKKNGEKKTKTFFVQTDVTLYPIDKEDLHRYVESKDPMDKAGAYGIQGNFAIHVKEIKGDYNNVVGLPIGRVYQELKSL